MQPVFAYLIKMLLCSAILLGYYWVALRNERFHQWNRFYLMFAMLLGIVVPFFHLPIMAREEPTLVINMVAALPWNQVPITVSRFSWKDGLLLACLVVSVAMLLHLLLSVLRIYKLYRRHEHTRLNDVSLVITKEQTAPFSFFKWLFWRADIDPDSINGQRMLQHELTHISEKHSADKLFAELVLIVFWMNPFFWIIRRELYAIHEFLADQKAIQKHDGAAFAAMILQAAHPASTPALSNPFFSSQLKRRLVMITTSRAPKYSYLRRISGLILMSVTTLVLILSIEYAQAQKTPKKSAPPPAIPPPPSPVKAAPLPDSIVSISVNKNNDYERVTYKMKDGRVLHMSVKEAEKNGYPLPAPPPPPPAVPGILPSEDLPAKSPANPKSPVPPVPPLPPTPPAASADREWEQASSGDHQQLLNELINSKGPAPLIIYAGIEISKDQMNQIDPKKIYTVEVLRGEAAINSYGTKAKNGVVKITPKNANYSERQDYKHAPVEEKVTMYGTNVKGSGNPVYILNGTRVTETEAKATLDPRDIEKINVLKGQDAINKYGQDAKDGAIEITSKPAAPSNLYAKAVTLPAFPGGKTGWLKYLEKSLKYPEKAQEAGTQGVAVVEFIVDQAGNISNLAVVKDPGDGLGDEALRIIKQGPRWVPAEQDGVPVTVKTTQAITFRLE